MKASIIGVWSTNALVASSSQEDEIVVFRSDGTGWIEWQSYNIRQIEFFLWEPTSSGWFVLTSEGRYERDFRNPKRYICNEKPKEHMWEHLPFQRGTYKQRTAYR